jgi:hypothetical protein
MRWSATSFGMNSLVTPVATTPRYFAILVWPAGVLSVPAIAELSTSFDA